MFVKGHSKMVASSMHHVTKKNVKRMNKKVTLMIFIVFLTGKTYCQEIKIDNLNYPDGIYLTKNDFIQKTPSQQNLDLVFEKIPLIVETDSLIRRCKFFEKQTGKKIKKAFAIKYNQLLYVRTGAILKNRNKKDKGLSASSQYDFVLVLLGGDNFLYTEAGLINPWKTGVSAGVSNSVRGIVGSTLGDAIENSYPTTTIYGKGVVWDVKKNEFNVFTDCNDFNEFIEPFQIEKLNCNAPFINLDEIRQKIDKIK